MQSITPSCTHNGLGSFPFARRYSGNRFFFLFLRLLRCFSSAGSLHIPMDSVYDTWGLLKWVSPFRNQRVIGYLLLTAAYRSLSRLSSALSAKASTLRPFLLNLPSYRSVWNMMWFLFDWIFRFLRAFIFMNLIVWIFVKYFGCLVNYKWLFIIIISLYEVLKVHISLLL